MYTFIYTPHTIRRYETSTKFSLNYQPDHKTPGKISHRNHFPRLDFALINKYRYTIHVLPDKEGLDIEKRASIISMDEFVRTFRPNMGTENVGPSRPNRNRSRSNFKGFVLSWERCVSILRVFIACTDDVLIVWGVMMYELKRELCHMGKLSYV